MVNNTVFDYGVMFVLIGGAEMKRDEITITMRRWKWEKIESGYSIYCRAFDRDANILKEFKNRITSAQSYAKAMAGIGNVKQEE